MLRVIDAVAQAAQEAMACGWECEARALLALQRSLVQSLADDESIDAWFGEAEQLAALCPRVPLGEIIDLARQEDR